MMWPFSGSKKNKNKAPAETNGHEDSGNADNRFTQLYTEDGKLHLDVVGELRSALEQEGHTIEREGDMLAHPETGLVFIAFGHEVNPAASGGIHLITTINTSHNDLSDGLMEFQHGMGDDMHSAAQFGFSQWAQIDFPVLCDATRAEPEHCMVMEMGFPAKNGKPEFKRRLLLGPTAHFESKNLAAEKPAKEETKCDDGSCEEDHEFCPCCLITNSMESFMPLIEKDEVFGLRLLANRDDNGAATADCRVNGDDFHEGEQALIKYAQGWEDHGLEFRKQYVIFQTLPIQSQDSKQA